MISASKLQTIKAILFDKDGTLLDFQRSWSGNLLEAALLAANKDQNLANQLVLAAGGDPETGRTGADSLFASGNSAELAACWVQEGSPQEVEALTRLIDQLAMDTIDRAVPVCDLPPLFDRLISRGFILGVASSDNEAAIHKTIAAFNIADTITFVAGYDSGYGYKPEPGMLLAFCQAFGLSPHQVAMVGDNNHDLEMGRRAGAGLNLGVLTGTGTQESLTQLSDAVLNDISEIPALFGF